MKYADLVRERLRKEGMSIRMLSEQLGISYEHCRRIVTGEPVVSEDLNARLASALQLDEEAIWRLALQEKAADRFGVQLPTEALDRQGKELFALWQRLQRPDRAVLLRVAEGLAGKRRPPVVK